MNVHFIAIGGSAMHNLAIALHRKGYQLTGSDDQIFEPSRGRLQKEGILPEVEGWFPEKIHEGIDAIILGMHARADNPELLKAQQMGLKIYSYPEYIYEQTKEKNRVVIGGSHGKTSITSMLLHVIQENKLDTDYMVGAQLEGFDCMVKLTEEAPMAVLEGDEYLSSPIDRRPKFHLYKPNIALLSGVAWDHINVFPTFENYLDQFRLFLDVVEPGGTVTYSADDAVLAKLVEAHEGNYTAIPYRAHRHEVRGGVTYLKTVEGEVPLEIFGDHNLQNLSGALEIWKALGQDPKDFYSTISTFKGASRRLELLAKNAGCNVYRDFAHSPSKLKATIEAVSKQFDDRKLVACFELHTFSSLNKEFLKEYKGCMELADEAIVFYSPDTVAHKKLPPISIAEVEAAFGGGIHVTTNADGLFAELKNRSWNSANLLLMSSGNFHGQDVVKFARELVGG